MPQDRFLRAVLVSCLLHLCILTWVGFKLPSRITKAPQELEVVLINHAARPTPSDATRLAQTSVDGGGDVDEDRHRSSPLAASNAALARATTKERQRVAALEKEAQKLMSQLQAKAIINPIHASTPKPAPKSSEGGLHEESSDPGQFFAGLESGQEGGEAISNEAAEIAREYEAYQKRPRRAVIGGRTQAYVFAAYEDNYRARVERMGTLHYPAPHLGEPVYGKVRITVSIDAEGQILGVLMNSSSGDPYLDQSALDIVRRSAPFGAFTPAMRKKADVLDITRTFIFMRDSETLKTEKN